MNENFVKSTFLIVFILTGSFSCTKKRVDHSLSLNEYRKLGVPDPDNKWEMADYIQTRSVLAKLKWESPLQLPAKDSEKSGLLFEHMLSLDYLSFLQDSTIVRSEKARRISEFRLVYNYWLDVYTNPTLKQNYYSREVTNIHLFNLTVTEAILKLAREINESDDPADIVLRYGYVSIKSAYLAYLKNYLQPATYGPENFNEDLEKLSDSICHSVLRNREWMDSSAVSTLRQSLRLAMDSISSDEIRDKYMRLDESLASVPY